MAQTGYTPISIYYSSTAGNTPTSGNLVAGELAINTADGKLFYKDSAGVVQVIGTKGGVGTSSTTQVLYNSSGLVVGSANMTFNGTTLTLANDASISGLTVGKGAGSITSNTTFGASALAANTTGYFNTALGQGALQANTTGNQNSAVGIATLVANTTGSVNTGMGDRALNANTTGGSNTAYGATALYSNTTASQNTAIGYSSCFANTTGVQNTAVGDNSLKNNTTGGYHVAIGQAALFSNTTAFNNTAVGWSCMTGNTTGGDNVAVGNYTLQANTTGASNTALGRQALYSNTTASNNTAVGYQAGYSNTTGANNVVMGYQAGYTATTALLSTFVGAYSGYSVSAGTTSRNTFIGTYAGNSVTTGSGNTFIGGVSTGSGNGAGRSVTTGSNNTILGTYDGNQGGLDIRTASNYIVLSDGDGVPWAYKDTSNANLWTFGNTTNGSGIVATGNNSGTGIASFSATNASYTDWIVNGDTTRAAGTSCGFLRFFANGTVTLRAYNNGNIQNTNNSYGAISDVKLKENIADASPKLEDLCKVKVRSYNFKEGEKHKQIGVIAQELEEIFPSMIEETQDTIKDEEGKVVDLGTVTKSVKYSVFVPMLIKAVQELKAEVDSLKQQLGK